jgi:ATP-dependent helicase/nuclease subunit A
MRSTVSSNASGASESKPRLPFYAWLLGGDNGRARILRRLGHEANDALDEFLEPGAGLRTQRRRLGCRVLCPGYGAADTEVKRDMEDFSRRGAGDDRCTAPRGLEASVVIMADTTTSPSDTQRAAADPSCRRTMAARSWLGRPQGG